MPKRINLKRWHLFRDWETEEKRRRLRNLSIEEAFEIFDNLSVMLDNIPKKILKN